MKKIMSFVIAVVAATALAGCTLVPSESPQVVNSRSVPFNLLARHTGPGHAVTAHRTIWFVANRSRLIASSRVVALPAGLADTLNALLDGPSDQQNIAGITTSLPRTLKFVRATESHGLLSIEMSGALRRGSIEVLEIGQIVRTATSLDSVSVELIFNGHPVLLPRATGHARFVVTAADYAPLIVR